MIEIENKSTAILVEEGKDEKVTYAMLLENCIGDMPSGGMKISQQRLVFGFLDEIKDAKGTIKFDRLYLEMVKTTVEAFSWPIAHRDLIGFQDVIMKL